MSMIINALLL